MRTFRKYIRGPIQRVISAILVLTTTHVVTDPTTYLYALEVERAKEAQVRAIARTMNVDPALLLGRHERTSFNFRDLFTRVAGALGITSDATQQQSLQAADVRAEITDVKARYGLIAADTTLAKLAQLIEVSLAPDVTRGKKKREIKAELQSVLRLVEKDFLPQPAEGLPSVAASRDLRMRSELKGMRDSVKALLNAPRALDDANIETTLAQLRQLVSGSLKIRRNGAPRWTKDPLPLKDSYRLAQRETVDRKYGVESAATQTSPAIVSAPVTQAMATLRPASTAIASEVAALAQQLGTPAKAFSFVYDSIDWQSYGGVAKGARGTLIERSGNDWDQALLLRDLLQAQGYQAQIEWGKVSLPIARAMNLVGTEDPMQAANLLATAGFDSVALTQNGVPVFVRMTHAWVRALIPYVPNRGATAGPADTWVRLDPSFKKYDYQSGIDVNVSWNENDYLQTSTIRPPNDFYADKVWEYIRTNNLNCNNLAQVPKSGRVRAESYPFVPATLNTRIEQLSGLAADAPAALKQTVTISVSDPYFGDLMATYSANLADLWGRKFSITFPPATADDAAIIARYGGLYNTPAYLVRLKAVFSIDDQPVAEGGSVSAGADLSLDLSFREPQFGVDSTHHEVIAGETLTEVFASGRTADALIASRMERLRQLTAQPPANDEQRAAIETEKLNLIGLRYFQEVDDAFEFATGIRWHRWVKSAFEGLVSQRVNVTYNFVGSPVRISPADHNIDVTRVTVGIIPIQNDTSERLNAMALAGLHSSYLEGSIWEEMESQQGISATKALLLSRIAGQQLRTADRSNVESVLAAINLSAAEESEIRGAVAQGRIAIVPSARIRLNKWVGTGFILRDPITGSATYPISGGFAGGSGTGGNTSGTDDTLGIESWLGGADSILNTVLSALGGEGDDPPRTSQSDPVNVSTGNMYREATDFTIVARGIPIALKRTYNSRSTYNGPFGYGWTFTYGEELTKNADGSVIYREADGTQHRFGFVNGAYVSPAGKHLTLTASASGYTLEAADGTSAAFDLQGRMTAQRDLSGNTVTVGRDANGLPSTVVDAGGRTMLTFTTASGRITQVRDAADRTVSYAYNNDDLVSVTDTTGKVWTMSYDLGHNMTAFADPLGNTQSYDYDTDDRLMHHVDAVGAEEFFHYDIAGRRTVLTDRRGGDRYIRYDTLGRATVEVDPAGNMSQAAFDGDNNRVSMTDARGYVTTYEYDADGNATKEVAADGGITTATYDTNSRQLSITGPAAAVTNTFDTQGNLLTSTRVVNGVSETTTNTWDATGQLLTSVAPNGADTTYTWSATGMLATKTDDSGAVTTITSDAVGRVTSVLDAANSVVTMTYDNADRLSTIKDAYGVLTTVTYDDAGRQTSIATPHGTTVFTYDPEGRLLTTTNPLGAKTVNTYAASGDLLTRTDERGNVTRYEYDLAGRVTRMTDGAGGVWRYGYCGTVGGGAGRPCDVTDPDGNLIKQEFDTAGRVIAVTDSLGHSVQREYDKAGRRIRESDAAGNTTRYTYDEAGRLLSVLQADLSITAFTYDKSGNRLTQKDGNGNTWTYKYDLLNRLTEERDPLGRATTYTYDAVGNLRTRTDARQQTTTYDYEGRRRVKTTYPSGATDIYTYDALGRVATAGNPDVTLAYTYDAANRVKSLTNQRYNLVTQYSYDAAGNRAQMITPGSTVNYTYDGKNRLVTMNDSFFGAFRFEYDAMDRRTALRHPNGVSSTYSYDKAYRLLAVATKDAQGAMVDAWAYSYDKVGNQTSRTDMDGKVETFAYDSVYRLTEASYADGSSERFTYDPAGNRLTRTAENGSVTLYSYDIANQLQRAGADTFTYDANGNVATKTTSRGTTTFTYDVNNRLVNANGPDGRETNLYAANGQRVDMSGAPVENIQVRVLSDLSGNPILDWGTDNQIRTYRLYAPGVDEPLAEYRRPNNRRSFLHRDGLGSITAVTGSSGQLLYRSAYKAFGKMSRTADPENIVQTRLGYTSRENSIGDFMYYRARHYDTSVGRFAQVDSERGEAIYPPSLHRYTYAHNNPVNFVDPSGHVATPGWAIVAALVAYGAVVGGITGAHALPWSTGVNIAIGAAIGAVIAMLEVLVPGITYGLGLNINLHILSPLASSTAELTIFSRTVGRLFGLHYGAHVGGVRLWHIHLLGMTFLGGPWAIVGLVLLLLLIALITASIVFTIYAIGAFA